MHQLPSAGYVRLSQIIGNPKAAPPHPRSNSGQQIYVVVRREDRPLPATRPDAWRKDHGMAGRGYSRPFCIGVGATMTTKTKGRAGWHQATPKTTDSQKHSTPDPLIGWFNFANPSRNRNQKRGWQKGAR